MSRKTVKPRVKTVLSLSALAVGVLITGAMLYAGPLNPPAGPVTSTYKTLTEVEPRIAINAANTPGDADSLFKVTQPGSYYLTGNITAVANKHGIEIAASGVTLDLNGFELVGVPGMGAFDGVSVTASGLTNIAVLNGSLRNWGGDGVDTGSAFSFASRVEGVRASENSGMGIRVGRGATVSNCAAAGNSDSGIVVAESCSVTDSTASLNLFAGIEAGDGSTVANCSSAFNSGPGLTVRNSVTLSNCTANANGAAGISAALHCTLLNCAVYNNNGIGIATSDGSTISSCTASGNNGGGFLIDNGSSISNSVAFGNGQVGITATFACTVVACTAKSNSIDGIKCTTRCGIRENTCADNGAVGNGAGIRVTGSDNRIEGNNCTNADLGIVLLGAGNVMVKNTCSGNTINYDIFAGNRYGPIINITAANPATVSGNSAASTMGSTDPWANFAY
jgi:parallel beta-helix repeat protein